MSNCDVEAMVYSVTISPVSIYVMASGMNNSLSAAASALSDERRMASSWNRVLKSITCMPVCL